jgi:hypothetical protein
MHAVVLTFPGHFYQTHLTVKSLQQHYPELHEITFVLDDVEHAPWLDYVCDFEHSISTVCRIPWSMILMSHDDRLQQCVAGWWRQQLVKLTLDEILPDDEWFVVDGDVMFRDRCEVRHCVPVSRQINGDPGWGIMADLYVSGVLGISLGHLEWDQRPVVTSPIPFRWLDRGTLVALRQHVRDRFDKDLIPLHLSWFQDQTVVAHWDPPTRWVMSEWELIECYRRYVQQIHWPMRNMGSGYPLDADPAAMIGASGFVHGYRRDAEIDPVWFQSQGIEMSPQHWSKNQQWYQTREQEQRS